MKPDYVARLQRSICAREHCEYLDKINYRDPCAACPNGHWGQYEASKCQDGTSPIEAPNLNGLFPQSSGPGTELKDLLHKFGFTPAKQCKCAQHITEMNAKGIQWCEDNIPVITGWLREEAARAKLPFFETGAKIIIRRAISNAKKKQNEIHDRKENKGGGRNPGRRHFEPQ
jgi:hypothetical protein